MSSFADEHKKNLYDTDNKKDELETKFNFNEQDVELFSAKIQTRVDRDIDRDIHKDEEDKTYIGSKSTLINNHVI